MPSSNTTSGRTPAASMRPSARRNAGDERGRHARGVDRRPLPRTRPSRPRPPALTSQRQCARAPRALTCLESFEALDRRARRASTHGAHRERAGERAAAHLVEPHDHAGAAPLGERALERVQRGQPLRARPASASIRAPRHLHGVAHALARVGHERALEHGELPRARLLQPLPYLGDRRPHAPARPLVRALRGRARSVSPP